MLRKNWKLLIIILFALIIRLVFFVGVLEGDDMEYVSVAEFVVQNGVDQVNEAGRTQSVLNRIGMTLPIALFLNLFGVNEYAAVLFPLLASILTVLFIYKIGEFFSGEKAGLIGAYLWAIFPLDVFLATQPDPEGPLAMTTAGSTYFLMRATKQSTRIRKVAFSAMSALFFLWATKIKPSALPIIFVLIAWLIYSNYPSIKMLGSRFKRLAPKVKLAAYIFITITILFVSIFLILNQPWPLVINSAELSAVDVSSAWLLGRLNPVFKGNLGRGYFDLNRDLYTPDPRTEMLTSIPQRLHFNSFDGFIPVLLVAISAIVVLKRQKYHFSIIWLAILFFYLEFGIYPRSLSLSSSLLIYLPISHYIFADNFLYLCVPVVLAIGLFVSDHLEEEWLGRSIILISLTATAFILLSEYFASSDVFYNYSALALTLLSLLGILMISGLVRFVSSLRAKNILITFALALLGIASALPYPEFHISGLAWAQDRRENLRNAASFIKTQKAHSLYSGGPMMMFTLYAGGEFTSPQINIESDLEQIKINGGYAISEGCGKPIEAYELWPLIEFGEESPETCIAVHQFLPSVQVDSELQSAREIASEDPSPATIRRYIYLSTEAKNLDAFTDAFSTMVTHFPNHAPITYASGIIREYGLNLPHNRQFDLLSRMPTAISDTRNWKFGELLRPEFISEDGQETLHVSIQGNSEEIQPILISLILKSSTAYILEMELYSSAPFDLVRFPEADIPDSYADSWNKELSWTLYQVIFITPDFGEEYSEIQMELARFFDKGEAKLRGINLIEIQPNE